MTGDGYDRIAMEEPGTVSFDPIGVVRSPYTELPGMPLQSVAAADVEGRIEIHERFVAGLADLEDFSHIHVLSHLHRAKPGGLRVVPFLDDQERGVFATRSPRHPNPIGLSVYRLLAVKGSVLRIAGVDLLDGTPVLDIKPYVPTFDVVQADRAGWLERGAERVHSVRADYR